MGHSISTISVICLSVSRIIILPLIFHSRQSDNVADLHLLVIVAMALVWIMVPGVGLFYSGLLRRKNALSMIFLSMAGVAVGSFQWFFWGKLFFVFHVTPKKKRRRGRAKLTRSPKYSQVTLSRSLILVPSELVNPPYSPYIWKLTVISDTLATCGTLV